MKGDVQILLFPASFIIFSFHGALSVVPMVTFCAHSMVRGAGNRKAFTLLMKNEAERSMKDGLTVNYVSKQLLGMRCSGEKGSVLLPYASGK